MDPPVKDNVNSFEPIVIKGLREDEGVREVWLSHWHENHFMHLDLFEDVPLLMSEQDAPQLSDVELFLDGYGIKQEDQDLP